jgi:hypothetical protein
MQMQHLATNICQITFLYVLCMRVYTKSKGAILKPSLARLPKFGQIVSHSQP